MKHRYKVAIGVGIAIVTALTVHFGGSALVDFIAQIHS